MYNIPKDVSGQTDHQPTQQINPPQKWCFACVTQATVQMLNVKTQTRTVQTFKILTSSVKPVKRPDRKLVQTQVGDALIGLVLFP